MSESQAPDAGSPNASASGNAKVQADRELLLDAQQSGRTLSAFVKLSGPGWLQAAITLGGGSLAGALFLGVLGGTSMLWLQLVAITMGVIMLSAISYVTLSTGRRPFEAINTEINPALGWGWLLATVAANIIWCMPQFSLCYDAIDKNLANLAGGGLGDSKNSKLGVTLFLFIAAGIVVLLNTRQGKAAKVFDIVLKSLVGLVVVCFFGVVALLAIQGELNLGVIFAGFVPNISQWNSPAGELSGVVASLSPDLQDYWNGLLVNQQRTVMIAAAATAVGINMTFLLPYSMLARGWDKPFRGLARFDLSTGMAIPYVLVTSCVVIASAFSMHNKIDENLASNDLSVMRQSDYFDAVKGGLIARVDHQLSEGEAASLSEDEKLKIAASLDEGEKRLALSLVKRNAFQLSGTLEPLLGPTMANLVFGLGVFGMGFSTIVILMLINGYAFRELFNQPKGTESFVLGCLVAGVSGSFWWLVWDSPAKFWLAIFASNFGMMLLPIAYITFFLMMNSKRILGDEKPKGARMLVWNILMGISVIGATVAAVSAIWKEATTKPQAMPYIVGFLAIYAVIVFAGFLAKRPRVV
ncbi:MAG: divalent metal cation transporter [Planctomycetota bacterium]